MSKLKKYILIAIVISLGLIIASSQALFADNEPDRTDIINSLMLSPKLSAPDYVLEDFVAGGTATRVLVSFHQPASANGLSQNIKDLNARAQLETDISNLRQRVLARLDTDEVRITNTYKYIYGVSAEVSLEGLESLANDPDISSIGKDKLHHAQLAQGIPLMNATDVRTDYAGAGMSIAICDTGIDYTHPRLGDSDDFADFPNNTKVIGGYDCGQDDTNPMDGHGHGTCCAGIAAGDTGTVGDYIGGVAHDAKLYALKISSTATNGSAWVSDEIEAWEWCIDHQNDDASNPIMIISMSFGGGRHTASCDTEEPLLTTAAANCLAAGITIFVSSANDGYCNAIGFPACIEDVISVGAVYDADFGIYQPCVSSLSCAPKTYTENGCQPFSQWYATDDTEADMVTSYSNTASFLDLLAPANQAYTTDIVGAGGYNAGDYDVDGFGGTSAACPYAAGAAACLQEAADTIMGDYLTPQEVRYHLINTGDLITDDKVAITKPRVNLGNAVDQLCTGCDVWVDFSYTAGSEAGTFDHPYNTVTEAVVYSSTNDTICFRPGVSSETLTISKALTLDACGGTVIIGQ